MLAWNGVQTNGIPKGWNNETKTTALQTELQKEDSSATATLNEPNINVQYKGYETTINVMNGSMTELAKVSMGSEDESNINWEQIMQTATKHPKQRNTNDIGIGVDGKSINLDLWTYEISNGEAKLIEVTGCGSQSCYVPYCDEQVNGRRVD